MTVLMLSNSTDIHADDVEDALRKENVRVLRLNTDEWFSRNVHITMSYPENSFITIGI